MFSKNGLGILLFAFLFGMAGGFVALKFGPVHDGEVVKNETAYERIMRTQTLRCGYVVHPPHVIKDPASGQVSGSVVDIMNEAARLLKIKIEWPEEVGWGNTVEALRSGRVDAICTDFWMNPVEGRYINYSMPLYFETMMAYVRKDEHRFDNSLDAVNDPSITVAATDGSLNGIVAQQDFPKAKIMSLPNMSDTAQVLKELDSGKADIAFVAAQDGLNFEKNNPGRLRNITPDRPVRAFPVTIALPQNEMVLKTMLDSAFVQLLYSRAVDKVLNRNDLPPDVAYRVARPYEIPLSNTPVLSNSSESAKNVPTQ